MENVNKKDFFEKKRKVTFSIGFKDQTFSLPIKVQTNKKLFGIKFKYSWMLKLKKWICLCVSIVLNEIQ